MAILKLGTFWHSYFKAVENFWLLQNTSFKPLKKLASINVVWAQGHSEDQHHRENWQEDEAGEEGSIFYLHFIYIYYLYFFYYILFIGKELKV